MNSVLCSTVKLEENSLIVVDLVLFTLVTWTKDSQYEIAVILLNKYFVMKG